MYSFSKYNSIFLCIKKETENMIESKEILKAGDKKQTQAESYTGSACCLK